MRKNHGSELHGAAHDHVSLLRALPLLIGATLLAGCGLAETAVSGAAGAAAKAQAAKSAQAQLDQTRQAIDEAQKTADEQRDRALKEAGQ